MKKCFKQLISAFMTAIMVLSLVQINAFKVTALSGTYSAGDIITFGSYPQARVTNSTLISALNMCVLGADQTATYSGDKYKLVYFSAYTPGNLLDTADASHSFQDDNGYLINTSYWFKYESIQWRVLSNMGGELFVIAEKILASRAYNQSNTTITWEACSVRNWLNNEFYNAAFSTDEKSEIITNYVVNDNNPRNGTDGGNNTIDNLFLLSEGEARNTEYGFSSAMGLNTNRIAKGTDYAKSNGLWVSPDANYLGNSGWWLRSPGASPNWPMYIYRGGDILESSVATYAQIGVRPALIINSSDDLPTDVSLNKTSIKLGKGETYTLITEILPLGATTALTFTTNNSKVVSVDDQGLITAKGIGNATVTVETDNGLTASCDVSVFAAPTKITLNKTTLTLSNGSTYDLNSSVNSGSESFLRTYTSSDTTVATVDKNGIVNAKSVGKSSIKVTTYNGIYTTCVLTVIPTIPSSPKAASASYNSIKISWKSVSGVTAYVIYRYSSTAGEYVRLKVTTATSYTNTGLSTGKTYYYKVRAYQTVKGVDIYGNPSSGLPAMPIPSTPSSFNGIRSGTTANLSWAAVSGASGYVVYRYSSSSSSYVRIKVTTATSYLNTGISTSNNYYYKVAAYRSVSGGNIYGNPTNSVMISAVLPLEPNYSVSISGTTNDDCYVVFFTISNKGSKTIRLYNSGAELSDYDYYEYDRYLRLIDTDYFDSYGVIRYIDWVDIPAHSSYLVSFGVVNPPTWYDANSTIYYQFAYDGRLYNASTCYYDGSFYSLV